jgi:hypothetical protein
MIPIDAVGDVWPQCNSYGIEGSWYCYTDGKSASSCPMGTDTGYVPYEADAGTPGMCISGTTSTAMAGATVYGAGIGLSLNEVPGPPGTSNPKNALSDTSIIGFAITLSGTSGGEPLNVQYTIAAVPGAAPSVTLPALNGTATYNVLFADARQGTTPAGLVVSGSTVYDVQVSIPPGGGVYDYCITALKPITTPPAGCTAGGTFSGSAPICTSYPNYGTYYLEEVGAYGLQNDPNLTAGEECLTATCDGFSATFSNGFSGATNTPGAYPSLILGWEHGNLYGSYKGTTAVGSLPSSITTSWTWSATGVNYDAAYDIWFGPSSNLTTTYTNGGIELMVWLGHSGANPAGSQVGTPLTTGGYTWTAYQTTMSNGGATWTYIAYVNSETVNSISGLNLIPFFTDAKGKISSMSQDNLLSIQAGFEVYSGSGTVTTSSFSVTGL